MKLTLTEETLRQIHSHGEAAYPNEGAGFLLGSNNGRWARVSAILPLPNAREAETQHNRYLIAEQDYLRAELEAGSKSLELVGVFHSHPDHPPRPSEFDRAHALPNFSYIITSVHEGRAMESRSWRLREDRSAFDEETLHVNRPLTADHSDH